MKLNQMKSYSRQKIGNKRITQLNNNINQKFGLNKTCLATPTYG